MKKIVSEAELTKVYREWRLGNVFLYKGAFYDVETGAYVCQDAPVLAD